VSLRYALWYLFSPTQLIVAALLLGGLMLLAGWRRAGRVLFLAGALGLLVFGILPGGSWLAARLEAQYPRPERLPGKISGIVQLGGAERVSLSARVGGPELNAAADRYFVTLELARRYPEARVVFTGNGRDRPERGIVGGEIAIARRLYAAAGLEPPRLAFEARARDTCENARLTRDLMQPRPGEHWLLVTTAMHLPRAMACFRAAGWEVIPYAADRRGSAGSMDMTSFRVGDNLALADEALHEWLGLLYYRLSGRTGGATTPAADAAPAR
jgi:uncharacterized SAM-binding protein YcdF (DUF218 family)